MAAISVKHRPDMRVYLAETEAARVHALAESRMSEITQEPDRGADGPAATARASRLVEADVRTRGSTQRGEVVKATRIICECHIDTLHAQHHLTVDQWRAGIWFRRRYLLGYKTNAVTADYARAPGGGSTEHVSVRVIDARSDLDALSKLLTTQQWIAVESVAGCDQQAKGKLEHLRAGLDLVSRWRDDPRNA